jgi:3-hydroxy-3-methylglutaryl CoA synthase
MSVIVVGTDGSPGAEAAIKKVLELERGAGSTAHLVSAAVDARSWRMMA